MNVKSALDYSTLEILKSMSGKKERDVSKSCHIINKGEKDDQMKHYRDENG